MKIAIGGDHAGYEHKEAIKSHLLSKGYQVMDHGPFSADSVDYPDFVHPVAQDITNGLVDYGVLICGSGNGVAMTANKYEKVRCGLCWVPEVAQLIRQHNNANAIALPARFVTTGLAIEMIDIFFETDFEGGRHQRRVDKMIPEFKYSC